MVILVEVRSLIETDWLIYAELRRKEAGRSILEKEAREEMGSTLEIGPPSR